MKEKPTGRRDERPLDTDHESDHDDLFTIDPYALDRHWINQSREYHTAARKLAEAKDAQRRAAAAADQVEAEERKRIKSHPEDYGYEAKPPTVEDLKMEVILSKRVRAAAEELVRAEYLVELRKAKADALMQRKSALESLVTLQVNNQYSTPRDRTGGAYDRKRAEGLPPQPRKPKGG